MKCFKKNTKYRILVKKTNKYFYASLIAPNGMMKFLKSTVSYKNESRINFRSIEFIEMLAKDFSDYLKNNNLNGLVFYDRGQNIYCGIVKNFADSLRKNDIKI